MFKILAMIENAKKAALRLILVGGCSLIALVWLSVGLYRLLSSYWGEIAAGFALAGLFFLPLLVFSLTKSLGDSEPSSPPLRGAYGPRDEDSSMIALLRMVEAMAGQRPWIAGGIAALGGVLLVRFPHLFKVLSDLLKAFLDDLNAKQAQSEQNAQEPSATSTSRPRSKSRPKETDE